MANTKKADFLTNLRERMSEIKEEILLNQDKAPDYAQFEYVVGETILETELAKWDQMKQSYLIA